MSLDIYKFVKQKGSIIAPYSFLRTLEPFQVIVTMELLAELNYANNNNLNYYDDFLCDLNRVCNVLNMEAKDLSKILGKLEQLDFFNFYPSDIRNTTYVRVNQTKIIEYIEQNEVNKHFMNWDDGLRSSLNPINKALEFNQSTQQIKDYLDTHLRNQNAIPLVLYSFLNDVVDNYEKHFGNIFNSIDVRDWLEDLVLKSDRENEKNASSEARYGFIAMTETFNRKVSNCENGNNQE